MSAPATAALNLAAPRSSHEAVVLFDDVPQAAALAARWTAEGRSVLLLDHRHQGLADAADWLAAQAEAGGRFDGVHLVSHGQAGALQFGSDRLATDALQAYQADLARLGQALNDGGDLLWYGCDVAAGAQGQALLNQLAAATGRDSAGSVDRTGSAELGGDWVLERQLGRIEAHTLQWGGAGVALSTTVNFNDQGSDASWSNHSYQGLVWSGFEVYASGSSGVGGTTELIFSSSNQVATIAIASGTFTPVSIAAYEWLGGDDTVTFRGYVGGTQVATVDYNLPNAANNPGTVYTFSAAFANITRLEIDPTTNGNNIGGFDNFVFDADTTPPTLSIGLSDSALKIGETSTVTFTFSEPVTGFSNADITVPNGSLSAVSSSNGGITWTATFTPTASVTDATNVISVDMTGVSDGVGNAGTGTTSSGNFTIDTLRPTATLSLNDSALTVGETATLTVTFSEAVSGFTNADLTIANGTLGAVSSGDGGTTWTATFTPTTSLQDATNLITLDNTGVSDSAGNAGTGSTDSGNYGIDTLRPTATLVLNDSALKIGETATLTVTFSEAVTGFTNADLTIANGTLSSVSSSDGGTTWTGTFTPTTSLQDATNLITLDNTGVSDGAGNAGSGSTDSGNYTIDTLRPSASLGLSSSALKFGDTATLTVTFSEAVTGLTAGDLTVQNGSIGTPSSSDGGTTWTATFTPSSNTTDPTGVITLDQTGVADAAGNAGTGSASTANYAVDTQVPSVSSIALPANATHVAGQHLDFTLNLDEAVTVNTGGGTPYLSFTLDTGGTAYASYQSGSGSTALLFRYTVASGNADANGIVLGSFSANGATLRDAAGNNATITLASAGSTAGILVDGIAPTISSINRVGSTPTAASSVDYTVSFAEGVSGVDSSDFQLTTTGTATGSIASVAQVNASTYTVTVNTLSGDGTLRLDLKNAGTGIADTPGNAIASGYTSGQTYTLDHTAPQVSSVGVPANATYISGQNLNFSVNFGETVTVNTGGGTPRIALTLNTGGTVYANYLSGSGTSTLVFRYTVASGNADADGVALGASIDANGGTLRDAVGNDATLTLNSVGSTASVLVDATPPSVNSVSVPANTTYASGQNLDFTVHWNEAVTVNTGGGTPRIALTLDTGGTVYANYVSGSGSTAALFRYTVASGNLDSNGITVGALGANGGTLRDAAGNDATLTLNSVGATSSVLVDAVAPTVSSINRVGSALTNSGTLSYTISFAENVSGVDTSDFTLTATGTASGSVASVAQLNASTYTVTVTGASGDGTLRLDLKNAGTGIADTPGNAITTGFTSGQTFTLDHTAPTVSSVAVPANAVYGAGQALDFAVNFTETLTVDTTGGTPRLALTLDTGGTVYASYLSGSGSGTLNFRYTVVAGNGDANGISVGALGANGGTLRDAAGNDATLTLNSVGATVGVLVDTIAPAVSGVTVPAAGTYAAGSVLVFNVQFNEAITVNTAGGTPKLQLNFDGPYSGQAVYSGGSGSSTLQFSYTVKAGDMDANGITLGPLQALGGTLRDASGNDAALALVNAASTAGIKLDTQAPVVQAIGPEGASPTGAREAGFLVRFSEPVTGVEAADFGLAATGSASGRIAGLSSTDGRHYTVLVDSLAGDGQLRLDLLAFNTGIADSTGNLLTGGFSGGTMLQLDHQVPTISAVAVPAAGLYRAGNVLNFQLQFSEAVLVDAASGAPSLVLSLQSGGAAARYVGGSGSQLLNFQYTIREGDLDRFGPSLLRLDLGGASIRDTAGNDAGLALVNAGSMAGVVVEAKVEPEPPAPVTAALRLPAAGLYGLGESIDFVIEYSQPVSVTGLPTLALTLADGHTVQAVYAAGSGGKSLSFRYVVAAGEQSASAPGIATALDLQGGTLRDALGRDVGTGFSAAATAAGVKIDGVAPQALRLDAPADGIREAGNTLVFSLQFDEAVTVNGGAPALQLELGTQKLLAAYVSGSGGTTLQFSLTLPAGVAEGDVLALHSLALGGARLEDAAGNAATGTLPTLPSLAGIRFGDGDGIASMIENLVPTPGQPGQFGDGNADGSADRLQPQVVSGPVELFGRASDSSFATLAVRSAGTSLHAVNVLPVPNDLGAEIVVPFGLFSFSATLAAAGGRHDFSVFVPADQGVNSFWLFDPTAGWLLGEAGGTRQGGQLRFDFSVSDGGAGDGDGLANGEIVLLGGAAFVPLAGVASVPEQTQLDSFGA